MSSIERLLAHKAVMFLLSLVVAVGVTALARQPGAKDSQVYVLFILIFAVGLWLTEAIPAFAVSLLAMAFLVLFLGNEHLNSQPENIDKYVNTFSSSVIWLLLGGFFLAAAMTKTRLDTVLFRFAVKISGRRPRNLLAGLMFTTALASMLMSNSATTAMVIAAVTPLVVSLGERSGFAKALLLGIPTAAATGGMGTIIGSPPNAIAVGALEHFGITVTFFGWMKYGVPLALLLTAISCWVLIRLFVQDDLNVPVALFEERQPDSTPEALRDRRVVVAVIVATVGLWLTTSLHGVSVGTICAIPLVILTLTGVLEGEDIRRLPWDTLLLVAGGLSLGVALEETNLLTEFTRGLMAAETGPILLMFSLAFVTMLASNIMSNSAASAVMVPIGIAILTGFETEGALIIAFSASSAMFLPVSTPPNAIVYATGLVEQASFRVIGTLNGLLGPVLAVIWVLLTK